MTASREGGTSFGSLFSVPYLLLGTSGVVLDQNEVFRHLFLPEADAEKESRPVSELFYTPDEYQAWLHWISEHSCGTLDCRLVSHEKRTTWWTTVFWRDPGSPDRVHCMFFPSEMEAESPTLSRTILQHAPLGILLVSLDGRVVWVNSTAMDLLGASVQPLGTDLVDLLRPIAPTTWEEIQKSLHETGEWHGDMRTMEDLPVPGHFRIRLRLYPDAESPVCWVVLMEDLQPLIRMRQEIELRETFFRALAEESLAGVFVLSSDGWIEYANPVLHDMFGYAPGQLQGQHARDLVDPEDYPGVQKKIRSHLRSGKPLHLRFHGKHREGKRLALEFLARPIKVNDQTYLLGTVLDRTSETRLQEHLTLLQRMEAMSRLVSGVAHDFRNATQFMLLTLVNIKEKLGEHSMDPSVQEDLSQLEREIHHVVRMADRFARLGRPSSNPEWVSLNDHIHTSLSFYQRALGEDIRLQFHPGEDLPPVWISPADLEQILHNLLINARDAMPEGGEVHLRTSVTFHRHPLRDPAEEPLKSYVCLEVEDTGTGIPEDLIPRIFEPYFSTKGEKGTGLGLYVVYQMITRMGGWVEVDSTPGEGTTFRLYFPVLTREETAVIQRQIEHDTSALGKPAHPVSFNLLLVEDREEVAHSYMEYLERRGYRVFLATTLEQARRRLRALGRALHGMIVDVALPDGNGLDLVEEVQSRYPHMHILVISGYPMEDPRLQRLPEFQVDFRAKPLGPRDLEDIVFRWSRSTSPGGSGKDRTS